MCDVPMLPPPIESYQPGAVREHELDPEPLEDELQLA